MGKGKREFTEEQRAIRNERSRLWRLARKEDPEYIAYNRERCRRWKSENSDKIKDYAKKYRAENKESENARKRIRRIADRQTEGKHSGSDIKRLIDLQCGKCASCNKKLKLSGKGKFHVDHIIPISKGGTHWPHNLQLLCPFCNVSKHAQDPIEWAQSHGKLL